ncbi:MAG: TlpA disulfide reductase family protein, partial [Gemmatimonadota bacterium]
VVLPFWACWCGPGRQEMPHVDRLARAFSGQRVRVVGMNEDADPDDARAFLREVPVTFPSVAGRARLRSQYKYRGLPYTVVLDAQGRVIKAIHGFGGDLGEVRKIVVSGLEQMK